MAIVAHVSDVTHGPLVFMNILLMLGFVVHLYPGRHLILFPLFQIVTRYDLSVFKAQYKIQKHSAQTSPKQRKCFKIFNYIKN